MLGYKKAGKDADGHFVYEIYEPEAEIVASMIVTFFIPIPPDSR